MESAKTASQSINIDTEATPKSITHESNTAIPYPPSATRNNLTTTIMKD